MSAKKLRADPDDQPPIEERSIMMPKCLLRLRNLLEHAYEKNKRLNHTEFFLPRCFATPSACSIKIMRHI